MGFVLKKADNKLNQIFLEIEGKTYITMKFHLNKKGEKSWKF